MFREGNEEWFLEGWKKWADKLIILEDYDQYDPEITLVAGTRFYDPFFYRSPRPIIIYRDRPVPTPRPQEPRRNAFGPTAPPSAPRLTPRNAPIREFPKKEDRKDDK